MTVGNNIKSIRLRRNYTQKYIAQALGMSHANYGKIENGVIGIAPERNKADCSHPKCKVRRNHRYSRGNNH